MGTVSHGRTPGFKTGEEPDRIFEPRRMVLSYLT